MKAKHDDQGKGTVVVAGWSAIASGALGLCALASLLVFLNRRAANPENADRVLRLHDGAGMLQFLWLIPVVKGFQRLSRERPPGLGRWTVVAGVAAVGATALLLALIFPTMIWDALYMFPQGLWGAWLMMVSWRLRGVLPGWARISGGVVGLGLVLVGIFPLGYGLFVEPAALRIPAAAPEEFSSEYGPLNAALHQILFVGFYLGVAPFPFWSALLGWSLLRRSKV